MPNLPAIESELRQRGGTLPSRDKLPTSPLVKELIRVEIDRIGRNLSEYERIARFAILTEPLSVERKELTPNLKLRRNVIESNYRDLIDRLYEG